MIKKVLTVIYILVLIALIYMFQIFIIDGRTLFGVKPNLILISSIVVSLWYGLYSGAIYSFIIGFVTDMVFGNTLGLFTISYTLIGIIIGCLNENYRKENKMSLVYVTLIATSVFEITGYISYLFLTHTYSSIFTLFKQIFLGSILNIIIVYIIYGAVYRIVSFFESRLRRESAI